MAQATNSSVWRSHKVFASDVHSAFHIPPMPDGYSDLLCANPDAEHRADDVEGHTESGVHHPDLSFMPWHSDTNITLGLWEHQVDKLGITSWESKRAAKLLSDRLLTDTEAEVEMGSRAMARYITLANLFDRIRFIAVFIGGTDAGSDMVGCRRKIMDKLCFDLFSWVLWVFCLQHQLHLMAKRQLARAGDYFSIMAKVSNCWRAPYQGPRIFQTWAKKYGVERAKQVASALPPRALSGRFGHTQLLEKFCFRCTREQLSWVFKNVWSYADLGTAEVPSTFVDDANQPENYHDMVGRWRTEAIAGVSSDLHWRKMGMSSLTRAPADHCMSWLQKQAPKTNKFKCDFGDLLGDKRISCMQKLIYKKADKFMTEYSDLLTDAAYADATIWGKVWDHMPASASSDDWEEARAECVLYTVEAAADFFKRIVEPLLTGILVFLWHAGVAVVAP